MDKQGNVYVNNQRLDEPYLANRDYGHTDIEFPIRYRKIESLSWEITGKSPLIRETTLLVQSLMNRLLESWYLRFGHCLNWDGLNK